MILKQDLEQRKAKKSGNKIADNLNSDHTLKFPLKKFIFFKGSWSHSRQHKFFLTIKDFTSFSKGRHGIKTRKHYFILSRQASTPPNLLNLNLFFPRRWRRPRSRLSPFSLPPRPGYLKVPNENLQCSEIKQDEKVSDLPASVVPARTDVEKGKFPSLSSFS